MPRKKNGTFTMKDPSEKEIKKAQERVESMRKDAIKELTESTGAFGVFMVGEDKKGKTTIRQIVAGASEPGECLMLGEAMWSMGRELGDSVIGGIMQEAMDAAKK